MNGKNFDSDPLLGDKYLKTKIKFFKTKNKKNKCNYLSIIVIDSIFKSSKHHYLQTFLENCKYKIKEKEIKPLMQDDMESFSPNDFKDNYFKGNFE